MTALSDKTPIEEFKSLELLTQINDLIVHYSNGHDEAYIEKAKIVKERVEALQAAQTMPSEEEIEDAIEAWGKELDEKTLPRMSGMAHGFRRGIRWLRDNTSQTPNSVAEREWPSDEERSAFIQSGMKWATGYGGNEYAVAYVNGLYSAISWLKESAAKARGE